MAATLLDVLHAFDAFVTFDISYPPGYARALEADELDAHRWIAAQPGQTAQQLPQAECAAQPTIGHCLRAQDGRQRVRPPVIMPPDRENNSYDALLDTRQGALAGGRVGFWDFNREQIERENWFEEVEDDEESEEIRRPPSPWPQDPGSLEGMFSGSLANDLSRDFQVYRGSEVDSSDDEEDPMLQTSHDVRAVARRLLALPLDTRIDVACRVNNGHAGWSTALSSAEERLGWIETGGDGLFASARATGIHRTQIREVARRLYELPQHWRE
ncbi:hypothetical protein LTR85_011102 [Meristemomyces frigidus]|nr:hypothetical protein LTR85_011102 [Meristemomyces frigidus]